MAVVRAAGAREEHLMADSDLRDRLARQRTELANERTLLAYIRTALGFIIVGIPAVWWMDHPQLQLLGGLSLMAGAGCLIVGVRRFVAIKAEIAASQPPDQYTTSSR
jgi:putative membrane protein